MWLLPLLQVAEDMQLRSIVPAKGRLGKKIHTREVQAFLGNQRQGSHQLGEGQDFSLRAGMDGWVDEWMDGCVFALPAMKSL